MAFSVLLEKEYKKAGRKVTLSEIRHLFADYEKRADNSSAKRKSTEPDGIRDLALTRCVRN